MLWVRKFIVGVISLLLLLSLIGTAITASTEISLTNPDKLSHWLNQSGLYSNIINHTVEEADQVIGSKDSSISLNNQIKQAAESAFSRSQLFKDVNTFLESNFDWLNGNTAKPNFNINLTSSKHAFAVSMGSFVESEFSSFPACSTSQAQAAITASNPLLVGCQLPGVSPASINTQVVNEIEDSNVLINNTVLTANSISVKGSNGEPYYQKLSSVPSLYRWALKIPWALGLLSLIGAVCIIVFSSKRRKGFRRVSIVLILSGLVLVVFKLALNRAVTSVDRHIAKSSSFGSLQSSLFNFVKYLEKSMVNVDFEFAVIYIVIGLLIIVGLLINHKKNGSSLKSKPIKPTPEPKQSSLSEDEEDEPVTHIKSAEGINLAPRRTGNNLSESVGYSRPGPTRVPIQPTAPPLKPRPRPPRPPRLIQ